MIKDEYTIENDYPLMESINHYAKISNNDDYKYKFIEIMKRIETEDVVFLSDLLLLETEFKCPIRVQLGRRIGKNRDRKLDFNHLRNAINATW